MMILTAEDFCKMAERQGLSNEEVKKIAKWQPVKVTAKDLSHRSTASAFKYLAERLEEDDDNQWIFAKSS